MASFEEEFKRLESLVKRLCDLALLGKTVEVKGEKNIIKTGSNIIIGNHVGTYKDVAVLLRILPRQIFFCANRQIFSREEFNALIRKHLHRHLKKFGLFLNMMLSPLKSLFVHTIASNIAKVGTIPVDLYNHRKETRRIIQEYLKKGRTIIALQGRGRVKPKDPNPYVSEFRVGASAIAYHLCAEEGLSIPVTPLAIFGSQLPFLIPGTIKVNVGSPMYVNNYLTDEASESVERFRRALEARVNTLFFELIRAEQY